ILQRTAGMEF
ncbi:COG0488: ATPase components of ABC transporters with duplicated ATPase domains, partial [Terribacillus sp. AE2B 122]